MNKRHLIWSFIFLITSIFFVSCDDDVSTPKPRGFFRLEIKDTTFQSLTGSYPYAFEYSKSSFVDSIEPRGENWINLIYPELNSIFFITYKAVDDTNLNYLIDDSRTLVYKQIEKADNILESSIIDTSAHIYGKIYEAIGNDAACPFQFWVTDREKHFFRGSLYMNNVPQNDSLAPIIDYLKKDMMHLIETFAWK